MRHHSLCSITAMVLLMVANCASAMLWISVLGGHKAHNEGGAPDSLDLRFLDSDVLVNASLVVVPGMQLLCLRQQCMECSSDLVSVRAAQAPCWRLQAWCCSE